MATLAVTNSFSAGTTIVAADMNTNFDDVEAFINTTPGVVQNSIVDVKGDLIVATAADAVARLAAGTNTYVLTADSTEATGLIWSAPTAGDVTGVAAGTNIDVTSASGPVPSVALAIDAAVEFGSDGSGNTPDGGVRFRGSNGREIILSGGTGASASVPDPDGAIDALFSRVPPRLTLLPAHPQPPPRGWSAPGFGQTTGGWLASTTP